GTSPFRQRSAELDTTPGCPADTEIHSAPIQTDRPPSTQPLAPWHRASQGQSVASYVLCERTLRGSNRRSSLALHLCSCSPLPKPPETAVHGTYRCPRTSCLPATWKNVLALVRAELHSGFRLVTVQAELSLLWPAFPDGFLLHQRAPLATQLAPLFL